MSEPKCNAVARLVPLSLALALSLACEHAAETGIDARWSENYRAAMDGQIARPDAPSTEDEAPNGLDGLTAEIVLENYRVVITRSPEETSETFVIENGIR